MKDLHHKIMGVVVLIVSILFSGIFFFFLYDISLGVALFFALPMGVLINLLYQMGSYPHLTKQTVRLNVLTQIWMGWLVVIVSLIMIIVFFLTNIDEAVAVSILAGIFLVSLFAFIRPYDRWLEKELNIENKEKVEPVPKAAVQPETKPVKAAPKKRKKSKSK